MAAVDDLKDHPRTFLRDNILVVIGPSDNIGGVRPARLSRSNTQGYNALMNNAAMPVYTLNVQPGAHNVGDNLDVYWCPYQGDAHNGTTLPGPGGGNNNPNVMFTYGMDGCTFAWGSTTPDKTVQVRHANCPGGEDGARQQRLMQKQVCRVLLNNARLIDPDDYYDQANFPNIDFPPQLKISTVTFGRRSSNDGWNFYTHQYYTQLGTGNPNSPKYFMGMTRFR
jgi:hypothetical protein